MSDNPNTIKSNRRVAVLNAAARRMGYESWRKFETAFVGIILPEDRNTPYTTDDQIKDRMYDVLKRAKYELHRASDVGDINQILIDFPRKQRGGKRESDNLPTARTVPDEDQRNRKRRSRV